MGFWPAFMARLEALPAGTEVPGELTRRYPTPTPHLGHAAS
jgi:hypothetical protein